MWLWYKSHFDRTISINCNKRSSSGVGIDDAPCGNNVRWQELTIHECQPNKCNGVLQHNTIPSKTYKFIILCTSYLAENATAFARLILIAPHHFFHTNIMFNLHQSQGVVEATFRVCLYFAGWNIASDGARNNVIGIWSFGPNNVQIVTGSNVNGDKLFTSRDGGSCDLAIRIACNSEIIHPRERFRRWDRILIWSYGPWPNTKVTRTQFSVEDLIPVLIKE